MTKKIIIGIDPGTRVTGYGIIAINGNSYEPLDFGCIRPPVNAILSDRYLVIYTSLQQLLNKFCPDEMALETPFINKNPQSTLKLGIAMGTALLAAKTKEIRVFGYSPREVKCFITGTGKAEKFQVQNTVTKLLGLKSAPEPFDATDALAIALCHASTPEIQLIPNQKTREI